MFDITEEVPVNDVQSCLLYNFQKYINLCQELLNVKQTIKIIQQSSASKVSANSSISQFEAQMQLLENKINSISLDLHVIKNDKPLANNITTLSVVSSVDDNKSLDGINTYSSETMFDDNIKSSGLHTSAPIFAKKPLKKSVKTPATSTCSSIPPTPVIANEVKNIPVVKSKNIHPHKLLSDDTAAEEERKRAEEIARAKAAEEERKRAEEIARAKAAEEERTRAEEIARAKAAEEERKRAEEIARAKAAEEERKRAEEIARAKAAEEERKRAEEIARAKAAEEEQREDDEVENEEDEDEYCIIEYKNKEYVKDRNNNVYDYVDEEIGEFIGKLINNVLVYKKNIK